MREEKALCTDIRVRPAGVQWKDSVTRIGQAVLLQTTTEKTSIQSRQWEDFRTRHVMGICLYACMIVVLISMCACRLTKSETFSGKFPPITHQAMQTILCQ